MQELQAKGSQVGGQADQIGVAWLLAHPAGIVPIIGSQQAERIAEGAAATKVRWNRTDWYAVLVAARGERLP